VTSDNGNDSLGRESSSDGGEEGGGANDVEGGDTEETAGTYQRLLPREGEEVGGDSPLGVVDTGLLVDLSDDGDGGVDGVGNDTHEGLGAHLGAGSSEVTDDRGVGLSHP
jgi:hypothetical protein